MDGTCSAVAVVVRAFDASLRALRAILITSVAKAYFALGAKGFGKSSWTETAGLVLVLRPVDFGLLAVAIRFGTASLRGITFAGFWEQLSELSRVCSVVVVDALAEPPVKVAFTASARVSGVAISAPHSPRKM